MIAALILIALWTLGTAAVAMSLRNLIHSALLLVASWAGIAAFYLWAGAEFVAFAQMLVYVGAVSMIVLFAVLLTRRSRSDLELKPESMRRAASALLVGGAILGVLFGAVIGADFPVSNIASVLIVGIILTVALLGAIVIAAGDREPKEGTK